MRWRDRLAVRLEDTHHGNLQNQQNAGSDGFAGIQSGHFPDFRPSGETNSGKRSTSEPTKPSELDHINDDENVVPSLSWVQEKAQRTVLTRLETDPDIERAFVNRWEGDVMIVTLGVRGVGTCELSIPGDRFGADSLHDFVRLAACIDTPEAES